jgi:hypothetical protein
MAFANQCTSLPNLKRLNTPLPMLLGVVSLLFCALPLCASPPVLQIGSDFRKMSLTTCFRKTIKAMDSAKEHFIEGGVQGGLLENQVSPPRNAWGFNETTLVLVHAVPVNDGVEIYVIAVSNNSHDAEVARNQIREDVFNGTDNGIPAPDFFNSDSGAFGHGPNRPRAFPPTHWGDSTRRQNLSTFRLAAKDAFQKHGLKPSEDRGGRTVFGVGADSVVVAIWTQQAQGADLVILASSQDAKVAEALRNDLRTEIFDAVQIGP